MNHYDLGSWCDYVRNLTGEETRAAMLHHLEAGCRRCEPIVAALARVAELAAADARMELSDSAKRSAKAIYAVQRADSLPAWQRLTLELIEGGALAPAVAGTRGAAAAQQLTYGGEGLELGLMLRSAPGREELTISGELLQPRSGHLAGVPAFLVTGQEVVDHATTDELGSFHLAAETSSARLCLFLEDDRLVELDLRAPANLAGPWTVRPTHRST